MKAIEINVHLGDNPNFFEPIKWSGLSAVLPVKIVPHGGGDGVLVIETSEIQTYADWQAHRVRLDGFHLGFIRGGSTGASETHRITVPQDLMKNGEPQTLIIEVAGRGPGLEDDFILKTVAIEGASLSIGWV